MCSTDLRQKREKYSLIVDYILYFAKKQSWWFCRLLLFCLAGSMCAGRPRFLGFVHPEEERKVCVRLTVILDSLLHQVFPSLSGWKGSPIQFVGLVDVSPRAGLFTPWPTKSLRKRSFVPSKILKLCPLHWALFWSGPWHLTSLWWKEGVRRNQQINKTSQRNHRTGSTTRWSLRSV